MKTIMCDDCAPLEKERHTFTLNSIVQHYGSMKDGHYVADIKNLQTVNIRTKD